MLIIIDRKIPVEAKQCLGKYGELMELATSGITYEAISGHPDIFLCQHGNELIIAPNLPGDYVEFLLGKGVCLKTGKNPVGSTYPATARYNGVLSGRKLIHHLDLTDPVILDLVEAQNRIQVNQGYCRCNLIPLGADTYLTSDAGIQKVLAAKGLHSLYVDPSGILLPGFPHGFIGGTCGVCSGRVFFTGSLRRHRQGKEIRSFLQSVHYEIIELYDGPLFDGGGIMFIN